MITEQQVKELVNGLIDFKNSNPHGFNEEALFMRRHGIDIAIGRINRYLLNNAQDEDQKYGPAPLLKTA